MGAYHLIIVRIVIGEKPGISTLQEVLIIHWCFAGVPGSVQQVVVPAQLYDVPGMVFPTISAFALARDHPGIDAALQGQAVEEHRIALADRRMIYRRRVGGVL